MRVWVFAVVKGRRLNLTATSRRPDEPAFYVYSELTIE